MKFSELWLRELVNPSIDSNTLLEQISIAGLKVDSVEPVANHFSGVFVGRIIECWIHPNIDKFWITKVDIGAKHLLNIICDNPNCRVNLKVAVATVDTLLPENLKIKFDKLCDNLFSEGMLCSFSELGISDGQNNIIALPVDAPIGLDIREYLQLNDNIINISVTPNRADCFSLLGIARDVAVINHMTLQYPIIDAVIPVIKDTLPIHVERPDICPRYLGRVVKNIDANIATPLWMKEKLRRCGIHSVNVVIDITNYVLLELGQPIHAFDLNQIEGGIVVRMVWPNESLILLDGSKIILLPDTLVIADQKKVQAIAGIFIGTSSSINLKTKDIVLECAFFNPLAIASSARRYGLHTNTSHRYERGVDPTLPACAIERVSALLLAICGGQPGPVIDITTQEELPQHLNIILRRKKLNCVIGHVIPDKDVINILIGLGCQVSSTIDGWYVKAPTWRFDIVIEEDLIEEIIRIYGYNAIPNIPVYSTLEIPFYHKAILPLSRIKTLLIDRGYHEVITYSFVNPSIQALLHPQQISLMLPCPISVDMSVMRLSLWTGLLGTVIYNQNRQQQRIRLFESGLCFFPDNTADLGVRQDLMLSGVITGPRFDKDWNSIRQSVDFYDIKGDIEAIFELTVKLDNIKFRTQINPALHPGQSAAIYLKDEFVGFIGAIHPELEAKLNLNSRTLVFEILWEKIAKHKIPKINNISRFPANRRDISVIVAENVTVSSVIEECKKVNSNQLIEVNLFDVYKGNGIAKGFKSLAISLILQDTFRTLKEEEIVTIVEKCVTTLKQKFQASLRD